MRSPPSTDSSRKAYGELPAMRMNVPTGVCRSASTERTTGTTLPCRASRYNASNDGRCRSSIDPVNLENLVNLSNDLSKPRAVQPMSAIDNQHDTVDKTRRVRTQKHRGLLNIRNSPETSNRNLLQ